MGFLTRRKLMKALPPVPNYPTEPPPVPAETRPRRRPVPLNNSPPPSYNAPQPSDFQPAGYLPPPPPCNAGQPPPSYHQPAPSQYTQQQTPIVVNQHYYLLPAPSSKDEDIQASPQSSGCNLTKMVVGSAINLTQQVMPGVLPTLLEEGHPARDACTAVDQIYDRFNDIMTLIDRERYCGNERELFLCQPSSNSSSSSSSDVASKGQPTAKPRKSHAARKDRDHHPKGQTTAVAATVISGNYFAKVELYANARLPMNLPPLKLYIPTWPLLCLAAQYSERVYEKLRGKERDVQVDADVRTGAKAMVIKSVPMDHMNTIVFAIRGTSTFMDWAVNLNTAPTPPVGFLVSHRARMVWHHVYSSTDANQKSLLRTYRTMSATTATQASSALRAR